ncbi:M14 family zinc carboxypeptidase [Bailinhaonella thermotolerans]|uniref:Peptidase M14 n=1 Tax=Bailinhaonella thermotolerans TaxID=1070861 RepID=A0A3A4AVW1_9ACTN|nr:M14 family zinc carboxypeptidase [Bailinhaonella thermotolerans]RJL31454.1 peptidase M14 [Bailinhaonella thermotolerans]
MAVRVPRKVRFVAIAALAPLILPLAGAPALAAPPAREAAAAAEVVSIVRVRAPDRADRERLLRLDLDVMDGDRENVHVMLHGSADEARLRSTGLPVSVVVPDVAARNREARRAEEARALRRTASRLPTGRVTYRTLEETAEELARLEREHPGKVRRFALPLKSLLGHTVWAAEISRDVRRAGHKPAFLMTGLHHAREWPTVELTMEFAWDVLQNDGRDPRVTSLLDRARMIVVPIVNPDGFEMSRGLTQEQKRKNCRVNPGRVPTREECADPANFAKGVDPNRNYGAFWGGPGASHDENASNYRGEGPFSEPEIQNIRHLVHTNQITVAFSNHTPDARVLRAPSAPNEPVPADAVPYDALAQRLGGIMKWPAGPWPDIYYAASGTTEETVYYTTGAYGFTFEHTPGGRGFHPPYQYVIDQYLGIGAYPGSDAREAFLTGFEAAADPAGHGVISGRSTPGATLTLTKSFTMSTSPVARPDGSTGPALTYPVELTSSITVPRDGRFTWHVNPSPRPSQTATAHHAESWTITCRGPLGLLTQTARLTVVRGGAAHADLRRCL